MIIRTTIGKLYETLYKYGDLLGWCWSNKSVEVQENEGTRIGIAGYRIQIPDLQLSLREGELMSRHGGEYYESYDPTTGEHTVIDNPPPEDATWEVDASLTIVCELNEKDPTKYWEWSTNGFHGTLYDYLRQKLNNFSELDNIPCFIDTSDFLEDEQAAERYAKECEENYDGDEIE